VGRWFYDLSDDHPPLGFYLPNGRYMADAPGYLTREEARKHPTRSAGTMPRQRMVVDKETQIFTSAFDTALRDEPDFGQPKPLFTTIRAGTLGAI